MNRYRVEIMFEGDTSAFLIWELEAVAREYLIDDVVDKLRSWLGAKAMYLKKVDENLYSMKLATITLGQVFIHVLKSENDYS